MHFVRTSNVTKGGFEFELSSKQSKEVTMASYKIDVVRKKNVLVKDSGRPRRNPSSPSSQLCSLVFLA